MHDIAVQIVRFVEEGQPDVVECELVDAFGRRHRFIEKVPVVSLADVDANSEYPQPGALACTVLEWWQDAEGRRLVRVDTSNPYAFWSTEDVTQFVLLESQVTPA